jgi:hypothetical protein
MKTSNTAIHYNASPVQTVSKKTAFAVVAGALVLVSVLFAIVH